MDSVCTLLLSNLHCASCVRTIEHTLSALRPVPTIVDVSITYKSITLRRSPALSLPCIKAVLRDAGFDLLDDSPASLHSRTTHLQQCTLCQLSLHENDTSAAESSPDAPYTLSLSVGGMTCASCVTAVTKMLVPLPGISDVAVSLLTNSATVRVEHKSFITSVIDTIEDSGFLAELVTAEPIFPTSQLPPAALRQVSLHVDGMYSQHCPAKILDAIRHHLPRVAVTKLPTDHTDPVISIAYKPAPPYFTIRSLISCIASTDPAFTVSLYHPPTLEQCAWRMRLCEQTAILKRLLLTLVVAVPTFIIGVVCMSLVPATASSRRFLMRPIWNGNSSRIQWSLFFLATPVMFYGADIFHRRNIKEIVAAWRKESSTPIISRFTRFGSMNLLVSTGVSVAYFASIALLGLAASQPPASNDVGITTTYFDSVVFLTLFLLCGRYLEAYSKARTADAITTLGSLRPRETLLLTPRDPSDAVPYSRSIDLEKGDSLSETEGSFVVPGFKTEKVSVDLLEVGDIVRVMNGATPPSDGTIVSGAETLFDESSLTGEARLIKRGAGDQVFVGAINKAKVVDVRVDAIGGVTMLDHIIRIVREGQIRRAPLERIADMITSVFVPIVTLLAIITWLVWLALGLGGKIPRDYLDIKVGGWAVWSLEFAIAVFVVACPCGIGLAAPTALLVGSGVAAKHGILARGGGEAFQEMARVDVVVFDKTGTLTEGAQPEVSDFGVTPGSTWTCQTILGIAAGLESASSHSIGTAIKNYATEHGAIQLKATGFDEVAGRGVKAHFDALACTALIGNEAWMGEHGIILDRQMASMLAKWTSEVKSIVLLAVGDSSAKNFSVVAMFSVTDPLRREAPDVVQFFRKRGIETWMISGDNEPTAKSVAKLVGIPEMNVLAGVLPHQKAEKVEWLQANGVKRPGSRWWKLLSKKGTDERCVVAMVGDGINDAPALSASDIGIAIGSGSDVAISSASFILLSSNLKSLLTLYDLSQKVLSRVKQNMFWAFMYNIVAVPIAAGILYPATRTRLAPVWASLATALSSVSVVCSSLLLKLYREPKA